MRLACQTVARRANKEDDVDGRFFAKRFDCNRLKIEVDVLNCSLYVDLNWIHAGMADTPEESRFTSAFDRIQARWHALQREMGNSRANTSPPPTDDWLAPILLDERAEAYVGPEAGSPDTGGAMESTFCNPVRSARISNKGFLPMTVDQYLSLLDLLGRVIRAGKRGYIPADLPPILQRLGLEPQTWLASFLDLFRGDPHPPPLALVTG